MTRTQIQLPDALYKRAKAFAAEREISLAEIARRGMELFLARFPEKAPKKWKLPKVQGGGIKVPLERLHDITSDEETFRQLSSIMLSLDTNILLPAVEAGNSNHRRAADYIASLQEQSDVAISEFILLELYNLLRNPAAVARPLHADKAVDVCASFRQHPRWQILGFPPNSSSFHDALWPRLRESQFARRRAYDWRTALSLLQQGVTEFATANTKDFEGLGFAKVWNPLKD